MVQLLELENGNVILFNDENIKEEDVIETFEMGEYSSYFIVMTKRQYENIFKSLVDYLICFKQLKSLNFMLYYLYGI